MSETSTRWAIGVMTGTSMDGLDAALVSIEGSGLSMHVQLIDDHSLPLGPLREQFRQLADGQPSTADAIAQLAWDFGMLHASAIQQLLAGRDRSIDLVSVHGQTVVHHPPITWQLINIAPISRVVQCPIVSDLRQLDLARCGEGAPITPLADWIMFRKPGCNRQIINLGGFANVTRLHRDGTLDSISGRDLCSCNRLLDAIAQAHWGEQFDAGGQMALSGQADGDTVAALVDILRQQHQQGTSLGDASPLLRWVAEQVPPSLSSADLAASAVQAIAHVIAEDVNHAGADEVYLAGGGALHAGLTQELQRQVQARVDTIDTLGFACTAREAIAMAILGCLAMDGVSVTLPNITGRTTDQAAHRDGLWMQPINMAGS